MGDGALLVHAVSTWMVTKGQVWAHNYAPAAPAFTPHSQITPVLASFIAPCVHSLCHTKRRSIGPGQGWTWWCVCVCVTVRGNTISQCQAICQGARAQAVLVEVGWCPFWSEIAFHSMGKAFVVGDFAWGSVGSFQCFPRFSNNAAPYPSNIPILKYPDLLDTTTKQTSKKGSKYYKINKFVVATIALVEGCGSQQKMGLVGKLGKSHSHDL